jgi:hypothetical protein
VSDDGVLSDACPATAAAAASIVKVVNIEIERFMLSPFSLQISEFRFQIVRFPVLRSKF